MTALKFLKDVAESVNAVRGKENFLASRYGVSLARQVSLGDFGVYTTMMECTKRMTVRWHVVPNNVAA